MLTGCFHLNKTSQVAQQYAYYEIPEHYTRDRKKIAWHAHKNKFNIVRLYAISPSDDERFHLNLCLLHAHGKTSFEDVRTVNGKVYATLHEAALRETSSSAILYQLRNFCFAAFLSNPLILLICGENSKTCLWISYINITLQTGLLKWH